ncbi:porin [Herbaspirillum sp. HC18]|nr:porin [Herbaspirillum sp. HC18]
MKKSLLALTVLGALASTAFAQTNVSIYGIVDAGVTWIDNGNPAGNQTRLDSGLLNGSRWGLRGSEDLGGGLSANFQLENGFDSTTGAATQNGLLFGRQAWVGLQGGFGHVKFGRQNTVMYVASAFVYDPFGISLAGDASKFFNLYGSRTDNTIDYSITAGGFIGELAYGFGEVAGNTSANRNIGAMARYKQGPVDALLAYHNQKNATGTDSAKTTLIGGTYDFGVVKAHAAYAWDKGVGTLDTREGLIGVTVPVGQAGAILASYIKKSDKARTNADADQFAIGYTYDLSKRTALYTSYSYTSNDDNARYAGASVNGASVKLFDVGVRHKF